MRERPRRLPSWRPAFGAARLALVSLAAIAATLALSQGCGGSGSKPEAEPESSARAPSTPAPSTPAESTTTTTSAAAGADLGAQVFAKRCALCHGPDGHGNGVGAKGLKPQPRNFHDLAYMSTRPDTALLRVIHQGKGPMPRWQGVLTEAEMTAVLAHIRELGRTP